MPAVNIDIFTGALTVGTTSIASGTSGRVLYNNGGTLGEMSTTGSGTVLALATGPTFPTSITVGAASGATGTVVLTGTTSGAVTLSVADAAGAWTLKLPTGAGSSGQFLKTDGSGNTSWDTAGGGLTVGTTTITSGTSTRILYNNGGVLGEYTLTGTGTTVVMQTAPTLTGPVTLNAAVGSSGLTITGATQTTSQPALNITQTWNGGAVTFTGLKANITNTASAAASYLLDLQVGGSSKMNVRRDGTIQLASVGIEFVNGLSGYGITIGGGGYVDGMHLKWGGGTSGVAIGGLKVNFASTCAVGWSSTSDANVTPDLIITRDAANTLALRNSTNAQTFRIYNTYTSSTNHEFGKQTWASNVYRIGTDKGSGGGTAREMTLDYGGTATAAISVPITSGQLTLGGGLNHGANYDQFGEMTAPSAPATDSVRIYAEDNGAGKTRLMALFATGAAQQIAIEP